MILLGSLVNAGAIVVGGLIGMFAGKLLPERLRGSVMAALSLMTIGIAAPGLLKSANALIPIISMVVGTIIGELLNIDAAVNKLGDALQKNATAAPSPRASSPARWYLPSVRWPSWARWKAACSISTAS